MNKKKCEVCGSSHTVKNGLRKGVQLYKCQDCGYQFRAGVEVSEDDLWDAYQQGKQTIKEFSERFGKSIAPIKRRLHGIKREWVQPPRSGEGFVHLDVTYWGRGFGVLLALDSQTGKPLYLAFVRSETVKDYEGTFTDLKKNLNNHSGLTLEDRKRVFLGIGRISKYGKAGAALIETPAHTRRFAQSYSSWSCSPAELHYASDCDAKV